MSLKAGSTYQLNAYPDLFFSKINIYYFIDIYDFIMHGDVPTEVRKIVERAI